MPGRYSGRSNRSAKKISLEGSFGETIPLIVAGVFKDIPAASHFHTEVILPLPEKREDLTYVYLLTKEGQNLAGLRDKLTAVLEKEHPDEQTDIAVQLMPLTDIHLHSRNLREMEPNGNIRFVYLTLGANALLLIVVLFNLWLNASLIFAHSRRYYYLLRLNGATRSHILREEAALAALLGVLSVAGGLFLSAPPCVSEASICRKFWEVN